MNYCKCLGGLGEKKSNNGTQFFQQDRVYSIGDVSLCIPANLPTGSYSYIDIKELNGEKCLTQEVNSKCLSRAEQSRAEQSRAEQSRLGNLFNENYGMNYAGNVWDSGFVSPALTTMQGGGREPMVTEVKELNTMDDGTCITLKAQYVQTSAANMCRKGTFGATGAISIKAIDEQNDIVRDDVVGTLQTDGNSPKHNNRVLEITKNPSDLDDWIWEVDGTKYLIRIRKLTPRECWRLMAFGQQNEDGTWNDDAFDKAEQVCSNTQLYKQAGNSIVVDILYHAFKQML